jgi:hypothetical protein
MKRIRNLAESNKKTYGNRTPDCCQWLKWFKTDETDSQLNSNL